MSKTTFRFAAYCAIQAGMFCLPVSGVMLLIIFVVLIAGLERFSWLPWLRGSWFVIIMAVLPAFFGFPFFHPDGSLSSWLPYLRRSLQFLLVFISAAWLSHGMRPMDLADLLRILLRPFGKKFSATVSRAGSLMLAFMPWAREDLRKANEAALLRGSNPKRHPVAHLYALAIPVSIRALERARHSAEALALRDEAHNFSQAVEQDASTANQESRP